MKYIVVCLGDIEQIFVFPLTVNHDRMFEAIEAIRLGDERNWNRNYGGTNPISAGFVFDGRCSGRSETLGLASRGDKDTALLTESGGLRS